MCFTVAALCPHGAADSEHAGQRPQAESSGTAPHDCSVEETGLEEELIIITVILLFNMSPVPSSRSPLTPT